MKRIALMIAFFIALGAQAIAADLNIRTNGNAPLKVVIDGQLVSTNSTTASVTNLNAGYHNIQVFSLLQNYNSYNEVPLYIGQIFLPKQTVTNAFVSKNQFIVEEQFAINYNQAPNHNEQNNYYDNQHYDNNQYYGNNQYGQYYNTKPVTWSNAPQQQQCGFVPAPPVVVCQQVAPVVQIYAMNDASFNQLRASIESQWFSDGKMVVFNQALQANYFTTQQVNALINLFSFSNDKLEVAKKAYLKTVDKENYFMVYNSLQWNSSIQSLSNYIASL